MEHIKELVKKPCKECGEINYELRIWKNRVGNKQQGVYCADCGKYVKFLANSEVTYFKNKKLGKIKDTFHLQEENK